MYATRYAVRPRQSIIDRQRQISKLKTAERLQYFKNILMIVTFIGCVIASGYCN